MADKRPWLSTESGCTYVTGGSPDPKVNLSGTATTLSTYPTRTFAEAATDSNTDFADTNTCSVLLVDEADADTWELYRGAAWHDDTVDYLDLSVATQIGEGPNGALSNSDTVTVYAEVTLKLDELAAPTDTTTLNVSATAHGLAPKHPNSASQVLLGNGTYGVLPIAGLDLDGGTDIGADLVDADLILVDDGAAGTNRKSALSRLWTYISSKLSIIGGTDDILLFGFACSDETSDLTISPVQKVAFDTPFNCVLTRIYVTVTTAASGQNLEVDINDEGTRLLNAVIAFQANNAETSTFAAAASSYTLTKGDLVSIDVDQIGSTTAGAGLKVFFFGYRT